MLLDFFSYWLGYISSHLILEHCDRNKWMSFQALLKKWILQQPMASYFFPSSDGEQLPSMIIGDVERLLFKRDDEWLPSMVMGNDKRRLLRRWVRASWGNRGHRQSLVRIDLPKVKNKGDDWVGDGGLTL